jgi:hypothetical protein
MACSFEEDLALVFVPEVYELLSVVIFSEVFNYAAEVGWCFVYVGGQDEFLSVRGLF